MASSVVSDNFETSTGTIPNMGGADVTTRLCSAWVNFNGTGTVAIRASYNISSITDNAVGNYTLNFTTAMVDVNYSVSGFANWYDIAAAHSLVSARSDRAKSTTQFQFDVVNSTAVTSIDVPQVSIQIFR